ncbi:hypothetical protein [Nocardia sp. CNY236]|uniref:hypothetical protein n=1 Tax=Nocardia sp. CNY236 TaxID=1169152 RepID=UPI000422F156|nr:hypothetical protein [Nocardia sp. CNY236]
MTASGAVSGSAPVDSLPVDFEFTDAEREELAATLAAVSVSPYRLYEAFMFQVATLIDRVPPRFSEFVATLADRDRRRQPWILARNAPIDRDVPVFDHDEPVRSKYETKTTFIAEAFLALFGIMRGTPAIGYINVNDGDVFQDIYPKRALAASQSQKALNEIYFHKDLANHFVRPDHVYMLGMRNDPINEVYTTLVRNIDILEALDEPEKKLLRRSDFYTPFDDLTVSSRNCKLGDACTHPILSGDTDIRFFEKRTMGLTPAAERVVTRLCEILHRVKFRQFIAPGDFVCVCNNYAVHAKEVVAVHDEESLRTRWIIKTVNVDDLEPHQQYMIAGTHHLVNG